MDNNRSLALFFICFFLHLNVALATKIEVGRYIHWNHPIVPILKKYNIRLYKVEYALEGKCPIFYTDFAWDPGIGYSFDDVYYKVLKANSFYPYVFIIKDRDMSINVDWKDKARTRFRVDIEEAAYGARCSMGS